MVAIARYNWRRDIAMGLLKPEDVRVRPCVCTCARVSQLSMRVYSQMNIHTRAPPGAQLLRLGAQGRGGCSRIKSPKARTRAGTSGIRVP